MKKRLLIFSGITITALLMLVWILWSAFTATAQEAGEIYLPYISKDTGTIAEKEPNDTSDEANGPVQTGVTYLGQHNDESDYYKFHTDSSGEIVVNLSSNYTEGIEKQRIQLQLYYQQANENNRVGEDKFALYDIVYNGSPGLYFVRIFTDKCCVDSTKSYEMRVSYPPTATPTPTATPMATLTPTDTPTNTPTPTPTRIPDCSQPPPNPASGAVCVDNTYAITFVYVPAGEFLMGSTDEQVTTAYNVCLTFFNDCQRIFFEDETPQHILNVDAFWIMKTEVTNLQYKKCVDAGKCTTPNNNSWDKAENSQFPVTNVDWDQASAYATWVGGRLPTEAEWEKAARGTDGRIYPWGNEWDARHVNYCDKNCTEDWKDTDGDDGYAQTALVGHYPLGTSPYGALDMSGNVGEWVADYHAADYYRNTPYNNPPGPATGQYRVLRSGTWYDYRGKMRTVSRDGFLPGDRYGDVGFRVMRGPRLTSQIGYNFESDTENWTTSEGEFKPITLTTTTQFVYSGVRAFQLEPNLRSNSSEVYQHTETVAYFNNTIPEGFSALGPYDLTGKSVACFVYLPSEFAPGGNPQAYIQLFVKDKDFRNQFNTALDIVPSNINKWLQLNLTVGQGGGMDNGFDSKQINALGISIKLHNQATLNYVGSLYIDHCTIEYP